MIGLWLIPLLWVTHEAGHAIAGRFFGYRVVGVVVGRGLGLRMQGQDPDAPLPRRHAWVIAAAGPEANCCLGEVLWVAGLREAAVMSVAFGLLNLLPLRGSDGRAIWEAVKR